MLTIKHFNSLPAQFVQVDPQNQQGTSYTRGKLKVFYVGVTADGREFNEDFSSKLLKTIGYAPIVSHYNAESDDFEGHAADQEIYGIVDPMTAPEIVEDSNGTKWAVCDTIIYDKRPDKTGSIASKIIGHAESLELDPNTLQYEIIRDAQGQFQRIKFINGSFIGVSVLGEKQEPAFTGAAFFENLDTTAFRGKEMDLKIPEFVKLSWGEKGNLLYEALYKAYGESFSWIVDIYDKFVIYSLFNLDEQKSHLYKEKYAVDGVTVTLAGDKEEVHASYEPIGDTAAEPAPAPAPEPNPEPVMTQVEDNSEATLNDANVENTSDNSVIAPTNATVTTVEVTSDEPTVATPVEETTVTAPETSIVEDNPSTSTDMSLESKTNENKEESPTASALSEAERAELAEYRKKEKIDLIDSFSELIAAEKLQELREKVDSYTKESLTNELNSLSVQSIRETIKDNSNTRSTKFLR